MPSDNQGYIISPLPPPRWASPTHRTRPPVKVRGLLIGMRCIVPSEGKSLGSTCMRQGSTSVDLSETSHLLRFPMGGIFPLPNCSASSSRHPNINILTLKLRHPPPLQGPVSRCEPASCNFSQALHPYNPRSPQPTAIEPLDRRASFPQRSTSTFPTAKASYETAVNTNLRDLQEILCQALKAELAAHLGIAEHSRPQRSRVKNSTRNLGVIDTFEFTLFETLRT